MNKFKQAAVKAVNRNGVASSVVQVQEGVFDYDTQTTTNTEVTHSVTLAKEHIKANQYNYPNLVGKEVAMFYLANNTLTFKPAARDKIVFQSETWTVSEIKEDWAGGECCMYRIVATKG